MGATDTGFKKEEVVGVNLVELLSKEEKLQAEVYSLKSMAIGLRLQELNRQTVDLQREHAEIHKERVEFIQDVKKKYNIDIVFNKDGSATAIPLPPVEGIVEPNEVTEPGDTIAGLKELAQSTLTSAARYDWSRSTRRD